MSDPSFHQPFQEQLNFFKKKLNLPSQRWDDILKSAHDRAFIVAGAQQADLLHDLRAAVGKSIEQGTGLGEFRKDFKAIVAKHGWSGWTGEGSKAGVAWRTKVIYQTNMATSYAAGRWQQLNDPELLKVLPYWQYKHSDSVMHPRPLHVSWDGLTLPPDHNFWKTHFPPNGWGCHCRVTAVSASEASRAMAQGKGPANAPPVGNREGIDTGFDYAPGAGIDTPLRQAVQDKLITYPPAISKALTRDINRFINAEDPAPEFAQRALDEPGRNETLWLGFVQNPEALQAVLKQDLNGYMITLRADAVRHARNGHGFDGDGQRMPEPEDFTRIASLLNEPETIAAGEVAKNGNPRVVVKRMIGQELFRAVFEVHAGKGERALTLWSLNIQTEKGGR